MVNRLLEQTTEREITNPYLLLTPGPLSTTYSVKEAMLKDWCTWDDSYKSLIQDIRHRLVELATNDRHEDYTTVLMQGSGTFAVEACIGTVLPNNGKLLVLSNGSYGKRIAEIARRLQIETVEFETDESEIPDISILENILKQERDITHVAAVHCETTTGILNPIQEIGRVVKKYNKMWIVDAMSSFGGIPMDVNEQGIDYLISSPNKCIQGVPGFGYVIANKEALKACRGQSRSLALDMYEQWVTMELEEGKWRYTSPTHTVHAFYQALYELEQEGGIEARFKRYQQNQKRLVEGMKRLDILPLLPRGVQSPFITAFLYPVHVSFHFNDFYEALKQDGYIIYPGKLTDLDTFRIGNIGNVTEADIDALLLSIEKYFRRLRG